MTREVAIKAIQDFIGWFKEDSLIRKALEMAIKALSQEPCDDAEQIDYYDDFETASRKIHDYEERQKQNDKKCGSYNNTNTFKSCCDCKLIGTDSCYMVCGGSKSLYKPKQKSEPCTDAVSREAVIEWLKDKDIIKLKSQEENARKELMFLPSVTQKSGKWIAHSDGGIWIKYYECSKCGKVHDTHSDFCPNCGADMREEVSENDR